MKLVINRCFGGFGISVAGIKRYTEVKGIELYPFTCDHTDNDKVTQITWEDALTSNVWNIHFSTKPIVDNKYDNGSYWYCRAIERNDPALVEVVEEMGDAAGGNFSSLKIVEIPDDVKWEIEDYDGQESVHEVHRSW